MIHGKTTTTPQTFTPLQAPKGKRRWILDIVLFIGVLSAFFDRINISVLFSNKSFQDAINVHNPALLGLLMTGFLFAYGTSAILLSFLGDSFLGPRRGMALLVVFWTLMMFLMGISGSFTMLLALRILLGVSEGPQWSLNIKLVKRWFPTREQGRASALWNIGSPLGSAIGFPLVIFLSTAYGWQASFFALAAITLVIFLPLVFAFVRDSPGQDPKISEDELNYIQQGQIEAARETGEKTTFRQNLKTFINNYAFWMVTLLFVGYLSLLWGMNSWLPTYLKQERHFNGVSTGIFSSLPFIMMFLGELLGSFIADKLMKRAAVCFVSLLGSAVCMYFVSAVPSPVAAALLVALSMFLLGGSIPPSFALLLQIVPERVAATANGVCLGVGNLLSSLVPFIMGTLIASTHNFNSGMLLLVAIGVIGSLSMLPLLRKY